MPGDNKNNATHETVKITRWSIAIGVAIGNVLGEFMKGFIAGLLG